MSGLKSRVRVRPVSESATPGSVSVVIPCYNYARYVEDCVASVLSQTGAQVEVIVVDDKSTDESLSVATALSARDPRVVVLANERNSGMVETFNNGLSIASGEFLVRLDADDLLTPGSLERALAVFRAFPSVSLVYGRPLHFEGLVIPPARTEARAWTVWPGLEWLADRCRSGVNVITSPEVVMRMSAVRAAGPQKALNHTPDMEMWFRLAAYGDIAYIHGVDQAWHREHAASMSAIEVDDATDLVDRYETFIELFTGAVGRVPGAEQMKAAALQALAREALMRASREYDCGRGDSSAAHALAGLAAHFVDDPANVPGWNGLQRRIQCGASRSGRGMHSMGRRLTRRISTELRGLRWRRDGIY
ncbi:glycosyltransferase family A protein [Sinomonas sp. R1AF57]|uniref:glycosyltransferase family 2 protein n=1 Tax=Sinomonas sp. R1AF57 TaxID=2020377 RepID=UPI001ABF0DAB|nr:glycosyltransferase family A protein [Sinomonas sp. R1AF57]